MAKVRKRRARLDRMARAMRHKETYSVELHAGEGWGLGRVALSAVPGAPQPVWNDDSSVALVMEGELYGADEARQLLAKEGYSFRTGSDAELLLRQYEASGDEFPACFNGAFTAAVWDQRRRKLVLVNDHLGLRPVYYARYGAGLFFAGNVGALLTDPSFPRVIDATAMAQMLAYEHALGDRTLLSEARLLPPGSILTFQEGQLALRTYWKLRFAEHYAPRDDREYLEELIDTIRAAFARQARPEEPSTVMLSGGLDSRMVLGALADLQPGKMIHTVTFGQPDCSDRRPSEELARIVGARHTYLELTPNFLPGVAEEGVRATDGLHSIVHMPALAPRNLFASMPSHVYKGYFGDVLWIDPPFTSNYRDEDFLILGRRNKLVLFNEDEQSALFNPVFSLNAEMSLADSIRSVLMSYKAEISSNWYTHFLLSERQRRFIQNGVEAVRSYFIVRTPFTDRKLVEFAATIPAHLRSDRQIQVRAAVKMFPRLAEVPWEWTLYPMAHCWRKTWMLAATTFRWTLRNAGLSWVKVPERVPIADYDGWMRGPLRPWVESSLLGKAAASRDIFNPAFVSQVVSEHMAGANHGRKLGMLLTLELWWRQFMG